MTFSYVGSYTVRHGEGYNNYGWRAPSALVDSPEPWLIVKAKFFCKCTRAAEARRGMVFCSCGGYGHSFWRSMKEDVGWSDEKVARIIKYANGKQHGRIRGFGCIPMAGLFDDA